MVASTSLRNRLAGSPPPASCQGLARQRAQDLAHKHLRRPNQRDPDLCDCLPFEQPGKSTLEADIYAFGQWLEGMQPGHRLAAQCMSADKSARPDCFDLVLEELEEFAAVRTWLGSVLIAACASLLVFAVASGHAPS